MRMHLVDWLIVVLPIISLICVAFYSRKYVRGVVDFLAAGRVAGRYVLAVGDMAAGLSVISLIAGCEQNYQTGFSVGFWGAVVSPIWIYISLSGYCVYRWRETRCLSMGQFLELRYGSKFFRIFCAVLRTLAEMVSITPEYTRGDRFIAYLVFGFSIVYSIIIVFLGIVIWNFFSPWPSHWWTYKFLITSLIVPGIVAVVSTIWFLIGGIRDIRQLFIDLADRVEDPNDNGQVFHEKE